MATPCAESTDADERAESSLDAADASTPAAETPAAEAVTTIVPVTITLNVAPPSDPDASVAIDIIVRTDRVEGYGLRMLPASVGNWLGIALTPATLVVPPALREPAPGLSADPTAATLDRLTWAVGARGALAPGEVDLCQFGFIHGGVADTDQSLWRLPVTLTVLLVVMQLIGMNMRWLTLHVEQEQFDTAIHAQLQAAPPNTPVIFDPPAQMHRQAEQLRLAVDKSAPEDFLPLADRPAQTAIGLAPGALLALDYHGHVLTVTLRDGTDTASLCTTIRSVGLNIDAAKAPHRVEATVPGLRWTVSIAQQRISHGDILLFLPIVIPPSAAYWRAGPGMRCGHDALDIT